ncbi:MAG: TolB family protein, partial [Gemmataceae bacterium]
MMKMMNSAIIGLLLGVFAPVRAELPPLIPREVLFGNPVKASPRISPDGKQLSFLAPDKNNVLQVWVQTLGQDDAKQVTSDKKRGIRNHLWTYLPNTLLYLQDNDGDENFHLYAVDVVSGKVRDLTPFPGVRAQPVDLDKDHPEEMLIGLNRRNKRVFDVYRVTLSTGEMKLDTENPGNVVGWVTDNDFRVRIAQVPTMDGGNELLVRNDEKSEWKKLLRW